MSNYNFPNPEMKFKQVQKERDKQFDQIFRNYDKYFGSNREYHNTKKACLLLIDILNVTHNYQLNHTGKYEIWLKRKPSKVSSTKRKKFFWKRIIDNFFVRSFFNRNNEVRIF